MKKLLVASLCLIALSACTKVDLPTPQPPVMAESLKITNSVGIKLQNPFVTTDITLKVADRLRTSILKCYYIEMRNLKRKLTFSGVDTLVSELEQKLYRSVFYSKGEIFITLEEFKTQLKKNWKIQKHIR